MDRARLSEMSPDDAAFLALPERLDSRCADAWRLLVADPTRSRDLAREALAAAATPLDEAWANLCTAYHHARTAQADAAEAGLARARQAFAELSDPRGAALADVGCGYLELARGRPDQAAEALERALVHHTRAPQVAPLDHFLAYHALALARYRQGRLEQVIQHHYANLLLLDECNARAPLAVVL